MELLVFVQDKIHKDFYLNTKFPKRGDVITAQMDGWKWGTEELADGRFRIIHVLGLSIEDAQILMSPEINTDSKNPSKTLQFRAFKLDLDNSILGDKLDFFSDHTIIDVIAKNGNLKSVEIKETVRFKREKVTILKDKDGNPTGFKTDNEEDIANIITYATADITANLPGIDIVGPKIRKNAIIELDLLTLNKIKTQKKSITDPAVIGDSPSIFG